MTPQPGILPQSGQEGTMRPYLKAAGMAFGLVAVWATLVPRRRGYDRLIVGGIEARQVVAADEHGDTARHAGPA